MFCVALVMVVATFIGAIFEDMVVPAEVEVKKLVEPCTITLVVELHIR